MTNREKIIKYLKEDIDNVINELEELRYDLGYDTAEDAYHGNVVGIRTNTMRDISTALGKVSALINSL
tara:strand:+ start:486 stop:689 length:204 start_codon:yes stop_codon:yes gene_type:complete